jgi:RNA polymerase sigma-70 factor (ECF subfamily)
LVELACTYLGDRRDGISSATSVRQAWDEFYGWCDASIRRFAQSIGGAQINVDDCAQEVWTHLLESLPQFRLDPSRGRFGSWLYTVVRSKVADALRRSSRRTPVTISPTLTDRIARTEDDPAAICQRQWDRQAVRSALAELRTIASERSYRVLHLRYMRGLTVNEVVLSLGISPEQVWAREHRMKRKLRGLLLRRGYGDAETLRPADASWLEESSTGPARMSEDPPRRVAQA